MAQCLHCGISISHKLLRRHLKDIHAMSMKDYIVKHECQNIHPTCACGCGQNVNFYKGSFKKYIRGHANRDPSVLSIMIKAGKTAAVDPIKRKKNSDAVKLKWKDKKYHNSIHNEITLANRTAAIRISHKTQEFKDKMRNLKLSLWSDEAWAANQRKIFASNEFKSNVSQKTEEALSSQVIRDKLSNIAKKAFREGRRSPKSRWKNIKSGYRKDPMTNKPVWYDSNWEYEFACMCYDAELSCVNEPVIISYIDVEGNERSYFPDFLVASQVLVEVKGQKTENDLRKKASAILYAKEYSLEYAMLNKKQFAEFINSLTKSINGTK